MFEFGNGETQRDVGAATIVADLAAAGFEDAEEIGHGGFGVVYRCRQSALDRMVAVKVLTTDLADENRERFFREQRAMAKLTGHPNAVNVLEVGVTDSDRPFIVMQYCGKDSLHARIQHHGPLPLVDALRIGVRLAGALETAHRLGVLHRDVKPANILLTDYGESALTDFGIAHFAGGFVTDTGVVTGTPAFTAPEVLRGESPSAASDVYGLGATLFCAITGHVAHERRQGEQVVAQFVRIATEPVPDLRAQGIPDDVCEVIERAMAADPADRPPTAAAFGEELREVQRRHGFPVDVMALQVGPEDENSDQELGPRAVHATTGRGYRTGNLPLELTSFIGRARELADATELLAVARLVTLTGIGGVGKTRLALRVATTVQPDFVDGVWFVELGDLADESLLQSVVITALGLRKSVKSPDETVLDFLRPRNALLILDNCEQIVDAAAKLSERILRTCPLVKILVTSRHTFGIGGEAVVRVPALAVPGSDHEPALPGLPGYDAVMLFAERAAAAVPTFRLTEDNRVAVTRICQRLDGLPLPIELAAARLRAMSPDQILARLVDSYGLLTRGSRSAPTRQQTLRWSVDWSHDLCTPHEQLLWSRVSIFAGTFELDAAEQICGEEFGPGEVLDLLTSLVDKSILVREEQGPRVRFRLLEILRDYGRERAQERGEYPELRRRHRDWYQRLAFDAEADWVSPRQLEWIARLEREMPNLREALEFCVSDNPLAGLRIAASMYPFWGSRGLYGEGRRWLDRLLDRDAGQSKADRISALFADSALAGMQGDLEASATLINEGRALAAELGDAEADESVRYAEGLYAFFSGDMDRARTVLEAAPAEFQRRGKPAHQIEALTILGICHELLGATDQASDCYEQVLAITESRGESVGRAYVVWATAVLRWRGGEVGRATELLHEGLVRLARQVNDPLGSAMCIEVLSWVAGGENDPERAAILMGAAESMGSVASAWPPPNLRTDHDRFARTTRDLLGAAAFTAATQRGMRLSRNAAVEYALGASDGLP